MKVKIVDNKNDALIYVEPEGLGMQDHMSAIWLCGQSYFWLTSPPCGQKYTSGSSIQYQMWYYIYESSLDTKS